MLFLTCPNCGVCAEETEFVAGGQAHLCRVGPDGEPEDFRDYLFSRNNPRGPHLERWRHVYGCGKWFHVARDTLTQEVFGTYPAQMTEPPEDIVAAIRKRYPDWKRRS